MQSAAGSGHKMKEKRVGGRKQGSHSRAAFEEYRARMGWFLTSSVLFFMFVFNTAFAGEVLVETNTKVMVREHPRTGRPYAVIIAENQDKNPLAALPVTTKMRPDYRMLDPKIRSGTVPYQGPVSDRKKVYIFAGTLAALGTAGGAAVIAAAPAATGAGAAGGAGIYGAAGTAVAAGTVSASLIKTQPDPDKDKVEHAFESKQVKE